MSKVLVPIGCRSDEGLSAPVIRRLYRQKEISALTERLEPNDFLESYEMIEEAIAVRKPGLALLFGDRVEMCGAASACFHNHVPIAHVYAGTGCNIATLDDINRHVITLWSDIQFCESELAANRVRTMCLSVGRQVSTHVVGITHLDDLKIDETLCPKEPYDLVLYNPVTYGNHRSVIADELEEITDLVGVNVIVIGPNPDDGGRLVDTFMCSFDKYYRELPRSKFLGLLKNCWRFISNSSAAIYEAPHFLKPEQIVHIGERNRDRDRGPFEVGASDRIVSILKSTYP